MQLAAANLEFERAAALRDEVTRIKEFMEGKKA
jgi:excinuclease UvrABC nuclease subunit